MINSYFTQVLPDEAATLRFATSLASQLQPGFSVYLRGDLGAGKTTLVRGLLQALGHTGKVKSPTYTIVEPYTLALGMLYHFDCYRFQDPEEWEAAGFREYFNPHSLCLIEWPEKLGASLPPADIDISFEILPQGRRLQIQSQLPLVLETAC